MATNIVFGINAVEEAFRAGGRVNRLYLAKDTRVRGAEGLVEQARQQGVPFDFVPQAKLNELAQTREHQGVVAKVSPAAYTPLESCLESCSDKAVLVALDQIQHPKNLGMLIRTAVGAGASGVLVTARGGALLDDSVVRASAGAVFHIPVVNCKNLTHTLRDLRGAGFWNYALAADGPMTVFDTPWADRTTLVLGNETDGIRPGVRKGCDAAVRIPLAGGFDSLNVAIAGGVALFAASAHLGIV